MDNTLSSAVARLSSAISSTYNCFLGQTRSQARLNAIASYDQSNELFKVSDSIKHDVYTHTNRVIHQILGIPQQRNDVLMRPLE